MIAARIRRCLTARSRPWARAAAALVLGLAVSLLAGPGGRAVAAGGPSRIARGLPAGAVAYLESDDLRGALEAWRDSAVRGRWERSAAGKAMRHGGLALRLAERVGALEEIAGARLDLSRLIALAGREAGIAVYDLGGTVFVFEAELADPALAAPILERARGRMPRRTYAGLTYHVKKTKDAELAVAEVGGRLVVSNSVARFHEALVLAARAEKVPLAAGAPAPGASLAEDATFTRLLAAAPPGALARVYVRLGAIRGDHYFDDYWIFGADSPRLEGVEATLLVLQAGAQGLVETRLVAYADPAHRPEVPPASALPQRAAGGGVDLARVAAPLAGLGMEATAGPADAARAADRILRLVPGLDGGDPAPGPAAARRQAASRLQGLLAAARPVRALEVVAVERTAGRGGAAPSAMPALARHGAIAIVLGEPARLDAAGLEALLGDALRAGLAGAAIPLAFAPGEGGVRVLEVPLADGWRLTVGTAGANRGVLVVASRPDLARTLAAGAAAGGALAPLLAPGAPVAAWLDLGQAGARFDELAAIVTARAGLLSGDDEAFLRTTAPSAFAAAGARKVSTVGYRLGALYVEQMRVE